MHIYENKSTDELNANDFVGGGYLAKEDLNGPVTVTIDRVLAEALEGSSRRKLVLKFAELEKPLILNSTNTNYLTRLFRTSECGRWVGKRVTIYVDSGVQYAGKQIGGIRVEAPAANGAARHRNENPKQGNEYEPEFA